MVEKDTKNLNQVKQWGFFILLSGAFNVILLACLIYWFTKENPPPLLSEEKPAAEIKKQISEVVERTNAEVIRSFKNMTMDQLIAKLDDEQPVEKGYTERDLALGSLVTFYHFDLNRALHGKQNTLRSQMITYGVYRDGKQAKLVVYPGLTDEQYHAITTFATMEKWPLTPKGLYLLIRKEGVSADLSLIEAFYKTPEFTTVEELFSQTDDPVTQEELFKVISEGNWPMLKRFYDQQLGLHDPSSIRRQAFLLHYIENGSKAAAYLLLKTDPNYVANALDDSHVRMMLHLLSVKTPATENLAETLLTHSSSDSVKQKAAELLYLYAGEKKPDPFDYLSALKRFAPEKAHEYEQELKPTPTLPPLAIEKIIMTISKESPNSGEENQQAEIAINTSTSRETTVVEPLIKKALEAIPKEPKENAYTTYTIQKEDSIWTVAKQFKMDHRAIALFNDLKSDQLTPGETLKIPTAELAQELAQTEAAKQLMLPDEEPLPTKVISKPRPLSIFDETPLSTDSHYSATITGPSISNNEVGPETPWVEHHVLFEAPAPLPPPVKQTEVFTLRVKETPLKEETSYSNEKLYIVQYGDTWWKISRKFNVDAAELKKLNGINAFFIKPGTVLRIP